MIYKCNRLVIEYKLDEKKILDPGHAKVGGHELVLYKRIIHHWGRDGDDRLVPRDIRGWGVAGDNFRRATEITSWRRDLVLCYFDSQV